MICEMCGKDVPLTKTVVIDGARLNVCPGCARFGEDYKSGNQASGAVSQTVIEERLQKRERRMKTRDIYSGEASIELVDNYGAVIRTAREEKGMDLEKFAESIQEKKGIISKIESNNLVPDDKIIKKIEKALGIKLTEAVQAGGKVGPGGVKDKMTLGNFVKKE